MPLQLCVPAAHEPMHDWAVGMQVPRHSFVPLGQVPPHEVPSHVAVPPVRTAQGEQDDPHDATSVFDEHSAPHA
jgi:hypothetical protein